MIGECCTAESFLRGMPLVFFGGCRLFGWPGFGDFVLVVDSVEFLDESPAVWMTGRCFPSPVLDFSSTAQFLLVELSKLRGGGFF